MVPFSSFVSRPVGIFLRELHAPSLHVSSAFGVRKHLCALEELDANHSSPVAVFANNNEND